MGVVPASFQKPGIDTAVHLDANSMLDAGLEIFLTNTGTALIPTQVGSEHILRVTLTNYPRLTFYSRPTEDQRRKAPSSPPRCPFCRRTWNFGTWWCTTCWEPLTVHGIQDRVSHMNSKDDRRRELDERYGLTHTTLQELLEQTQLACVPIPIPTRRRRNAAGKYRADGPQATDHGNPIALAAIAAPPPKAFPGKAPPPPSQAFTIPTQVGSRAEPTQVGQLPRRAKLPAPGLTPKGCLRQPPHAPKARQQNNDAPLRPADSPSAHLTDTKMLDYTKRAIRQKFKSHPHRYDTDPQYAAACDSHEPPTPRLFQFSNGSWSAYDGNDDRPPRAS